MAFPNSETGDICLRPGGGQQFSQAGQIDWVAFLKGTAEATISILTRLSASGVDPMTVLVAQNAFSSLRLTLTGQENVSQALSKLRAFSSFGNILWFGFGIQHLIRSLAQTREGLSCVALCGALAECYDAAISARILSEFADLTQVPRELSPSLSQWKQLVGTCGGCLATSEFSSIVSKFNVHFQPQEMGGYKVSDPQDVGKALYGLAMVSLGRMESITLTGGFDCGWLAAVAEWLLGLSVTVQNEDGSAPLIYGTYAIPNGSPQVRIVYNVPSGQNNTSLAIQRSFKLRSFPDLIHQPYTGFSTSFVNRTPWDTALTSTFGSQAHEHLTTALRTAFVTALGSVACIFEHIARASPEVSQSVLKNNKHYRQGSFGRGFLNMVSSCFPEIPFEVSQSGIEFLGSTYNEAIMAYESAMFQISTACGCGCNDKDCMGRHEWGKKRACLTFLSDLIIFVTRMKASIADDANLMPTQSGIYAIYQEMGLRWHPSALERMLSDRNTMGAIAFARTLYAGELDGGPDYRPAQCTRGLCFYSNILCDTAANPTDLFLVHVVPGAVQFEQRFYFEVHDGAFISPNYEPLQTQVTTNKPGGYTLLPNRSTIEAVVTEAERGIEFTYKVSSKQGVSWIPPLELANAVGVTQGTISCTRINCPQFDRIPPIRVVEGDGKLSSSDPLGCVYFVSLNSPSWWIALLSVGYAVQDLKRGGMARRTFLRLHECMNCTLQAGMQYEIFDIIYIT